MLAALSVLVSWDRRRTPLTLHMFVSDICSSICVPRATVHVLCFTKGSMVSMAEVLLNRIVVHAPGSG